MTSHFHDKALGLKVFLMVMKPKGCDIGHFKGVEFV